MTPGIPRWPSSSHKMGHGVSEGKTGRRGEGGREGERGRWKMEREGKGKRGSQREGDTEREREGGALRGREWREEERGWRGRERGERALGLSNWRKKPSPNFGKVPGEQVELV